jgi:DNA-binding transcriptional LysR family regulator
MNITLDRLRYFLEVARLEHVGLASKSLGISASAVSSAIAAIESEYSCVLFERTHQRIRLTERGQWLRDQVEPILEQLESFPQKINQKASSFRGYLSVGGSFFLAQHFLQPVLHEIQLKNPELKTEISPLRSIQVVQEVLNGTLEYGLCFSPSEHPDLEKKTFHHGSLKIVVAKNHPIIKITRSKSFKLSLLNAYPAAIHKYSPGIDYRENYVFKKFGIQPDIRNHYYSEELAIQSLLSSDLWAVIPDVVEKHYRSVLFSLPLPPGWNAPYEICSIYRKKMQQKNILLHLDQALLEELNRPI